MILFFSLIGNMSGLQYRDVATVNGGTFINWLVVAIVSRFAQPASEVSSGRVARSKGV